MSMQKGINPGRLKHKIRIMRYTSVEDELGNNHDVLAPYKTVWAEIRPIRGKEFLEYYKNTNEMTYKVTIRYTDVTEKDVIKYKDRQLQIQAIVNPLEEDYYLELMCVENKDHSVEEEESGKQEDDPQDEP